MGITAETREVAAINAHGRMGILSNRWIITKRPFRWLVMSIFDITSFGANAGIYRENQSNTVSTDNDNKRIFVFHEQQFQISS